MSSEPDYVVERSDGYFLAEDSSDYLWTRNLADALVFGNREAAQAAADINLSSSHVTCVRLLITDASMPTPSFATTGAALGKLCDEKNAAYGDSFSRSGEVLRILYPNGVKPEQYGDLLTVARVLDKLFRIATSKDALGENPWADVAGYGILGVGKQ